MDDRIRVTVAPGEVITQKHPSGLPGLPNIVLSSGDTLLVTPQRAEEMYRAGKVLHPLTGQVRPPPPPERSHSIVSGSRLSFAHYAAQEDDRA